MKLYQGESLKFSIDLDSFEEKVTEVITQLELGVFDELKLKKALHLFDAEGVTIEEQSNK